MKKTKTNSKSLPQKKADVNTKDASYLLCTSELNGELVKSIEHFLGYLLHRTTLLYKSSMLPEYTPYNIMGQHFVALAIIDANPKINQIQICQSLGVDKATMVKTVDDLVRAKFIERKECENDRRIKRLVLTKKGQTVLLALEERRKVREKEFLSTLSADEALQFKDILSRLIKANLP